VQGRGCETSWMLPNKSPALEHQAWGEVVAREVRPHSFHPHSLRCSAALNLEGAATSLHRTPWSTTRACFSTAGSMLSMNSARRGGAAGLPQSLLSFRMFSGADEAQPAGPAAAEASARAPVVSAAPSVPAGAAPALPMPWQMAGASPRLTTAGAVPPQRPPTCSAAAASGAPPLSARPTTSGDRPSTAAEFAAMQASMAKQARRPCSHHSVAAAPLVTAAIGSLTAR